MPRTCVILLGHFSPWVFFNHSPRVDSFSLRSQAGRVPMQLSFVIKIHLPPRCRPIGWWNTEITYKHVSSLFARFLSFLLLDCVAGYLLKFQSAASGEGIETALVRSWVSQADCRTNVKRNPRVSAYSRHHCLLHIDDQLKDDLKAFSRYTDYFQVCKL